ncbi:hypothetical protein FOA52_000808 [Chlamydomonas sp. UWO 241]|nr:hypothetical protein FOA52_000808 [Chlamydomonas sp. UWO 241]
MPSPPSPSVRNALYRNFLRTLSDFERRGVPVLGLAGADLPGGVHLPHSRGYAPHLDARRWVRDSFRGGSPGPPDSEQSLDGAFSALRALRAQLAAMRGAEEGTVAAMGLWSALISRHAGRACGAHGGAPRGGAGARAAGAGAPSGGAAGAQGHPGGGTRPHGHDQQQQEQQQQLEQQRQPYCQLLAHAAAAEDAALLLARIEADATEDGIDLDDGSEGGAATDDEDACGGDAELAAVLRGHGGPSEQGGGGGERCTTSAALDLLARRVRTAHPGLFPGAPDAAAPAAAPAVAAAAAAAAPYPAPPAAPAAPAAPLVPHEHTTAQLDAIADSLLRGRGRLRHEAVEWVYDGLRPLTLAGLLSERRGVPLSLALAFVAVARRLGVPAVPVCCADTTTAYNNTSEEAAARHAGRAVVAAPSPDRWLVAAPTGAEGGCCVRCGGGGAGASAAALPGCGCGASAGADASADGPPRPFAPGGAWLVDVGARGAPVRGWRHQSDDAGASAALGAVAEWGEPGRGPQLASFCALLVRAAMVAHQRRGEADLVVHYMYQLLALDPGAAEWARALQAADVRR